MYQKNLLTALGFVPKEGALGIYFKKYNDNYSIEVDFEKKVIDFGDRITSENKTTSNFSQDENWVVLECVDRLLEKGYPPQNIILEKTWPSGHGTSGRLDVCVTHDDGSEYLLIECKTYGNEFDKALAKLNKDGGQLFTYFKFSNKADVIMLYASELQAKKVAYKNEIIKIEESYRTGDRKDFFDKWNKLTKDNGVFDSWVNSYEFETKALTLDLLQPIKQEDSSFIFNRFLEILRHNVVSDKPNAFNKIFTLFLCKVYDEKSTREGKELKFQWLEGQDDDVSFQIRLTDLYKNGMLEFLEKEVTDFSDADFDTRFNHLDEKTKQDLRQEIFKLRLEKNNEFAIKEVFDHQSFLENAKIVKEVVELLQGFRLRYNKRQQYLSDFFELLLTTGLKQESGQFFTPVPIAQFIIKSLPIDKIVEEKLEKGERSNLLPYIMDYAAGSGHFLTESMHEVQRIIDNKPTKEFISDTAKKLKSWQEDHFDWATQYVYGIEKDYRLVKVGKVGCYLHGDGLANVILSDGLANFENTKEYKGLLKQTDQNFPKENKQFDIVISNPPYSVSSFKGASRDYYGENDFELYDSLTDNSSEIECLFIERTKQLLKDGGMAGIILPSSILNNSGIYSKARAILLQYFDILAIVELGSNTFMETGTNTVTLFLRRRNNYHSVNLKLAIEKVFVDYRNVTLNGIENPISKYVAHVWEGVSYEDYVSLLKKAPNDTIKKNEFFQDYKKKIKAKNDARFWQQVLKTEKEKLFYFVLTLPQKTVLVKSGSKAAEKRFLGYEFSQRRGSEGIHPVQRGKNIEDCTQLFDPDIFDNPQKASTYIYKAFQEDFSFPIDKTLKKNISRHDLVDMMTFDRWEFVNNISLSVKKKVKYETIWGTQKLALLGDIASIKKGQTITKTKTIKGAIPVIAGGIEPAYFHNKANRNGNFITVSASGANAGFLNYFETPFFASDCNTIHSNNENLISTKLLFLFLKSIQDTVFELQRGQAQPHVYADDLSKIKIPLPLKKVQEKIVAEIEVLEQKESEKKAAVKVLEDIVKEKIENLKFKESQLESIATFKNGLNYSRKSNGESVHVIGVGDFQNNFSPDVNSLEKIQIDGKLNDDYLLKEGDILVVRSNGSANLVGRFLFIETLKDKTSYSGFTIRIRPSSDDVNSKFLCYYLRSQKVRSEIFDNSKGSNIKSLNQTILSSIRIPIPSKEQQKKIVSEIEEIEAKIELLEKELTKIPSQKEAVLKKYL